MKIGYIRISRDTQTMALQEDAMQKEKCERVFKETMSGKNMERPELLRMFDVMRAGDVVVVWRLDRLGRSLKQLIETVQMFHEKGIELVSVKESLDTTTPTGKLMFHIIGAMAEFERDIIRERTYAGLAAARARGRQGGRPSVIAQMDPKKLKLAKDLYDRKEMPVADICKLTGFSNRNTFYRYINSLKKEN